MGSNSSKCRSAPSITKYSTTWSLVAYHTCIHIELLPSLRWETSQNFKKLLPWLLFNSDEWSQKWVYIPLQLRFFYSSCSPNQSKLLILKITLAGTMGHPWNLCSFFAHHRHHTITSGMKHLTCSNDPLGVDKTHCIIIEDKQVWVAKEILKARA